MCFGRPPTLREPDHIVELRRFLIEHLDEHAADGLALGLRVRFSAQGVEKALLGIDADDAYAHVLRERRHHLIALAEPQQSVIDEDTSELPADRTVQQRRQHGRVDAAGQPQQHVVRSDLRADACHAVLDDVACRPASCASRDLAHEAAQHLRSLQGVRHLWMEL
jgi:hypothetical protein